MVYPATLDVFLRDMYGQGKDLKMSLLFHGTNADRVPSIAQNGLVVPDAVDGGDPLPCVMAYGSPTMPLCSAAGTPNGVFLCLGIHDSWRAMPWSDRFAGRDGEVVTFWKSSFVCPIASITARNLGEVVHPDTLESCGVIRVR